MRAAVSVLFLLGSAFALESQVTPVQKVIDLMNGMLAKAKKEKQMEQVQFAAFQQFCDDTSAEKERSIAEANEKIDVLKADIQMYTNDIKKLSGEIAVHEEDITVWKGDVKAADAVRLMEHDDYEAMHKDYSESIDALKNAIAVLQKQNTDRKQAASFAQVSSLTSLNLIPESAKRIISAFVEQDPEDALSVTSPEAYGYEFQSQGVIDMLDKLLDKFINELTDLEKAEMNSKHDYDMLIQDHTNMINQATSDLEEKKEIRDKKKEQLATAEGDLEDTTAVRDEDVKYLADLTKLCEKKANDFEARQQLRSEEIDAVVKAVEIIKSGAVSGNADTHLPALVQKKAEAQKGHSFAALRADTESRLVQHRVYAYLQRKAKKTGSRVLALLAQRVQDDPFAKVRKMIKDLIIKLREEATYEAEHKGWCDTELATNEHTRKEKTAAVEMLTAEIDMLTSSIAKEAEEIADLTRQVAELDAAMAKATKLRQDEKEKNAETVADAGEAQAAVAQAITVLKEFYAKAADATALLQRKKQSPGDDAPEIFDSPYKGMQAENGGVVGMLEVIESDFARLEAETKAAEATAQKEYEAFMTDSKVDKETKETDIEHKSQKKQDEEALLVSKKDDLTATQKELDAALLYFDKLKPSCVDQDVSYEDRVARRKEEIESLREALEILNGKEIV